MIRGRELRWNILRKRSIVDDVYTSRVCLSTDNEVSGSLDVFHTRYLCIKYMGVPSPRPDS